MKGLPFFYVIFLCCMVSASSAFSFSFSSFVYIGPRLILCLVRKGEQVIWSSILFFVLFFFFNKGAWAMFLEGLFLMFYFI